mgnify:CR=1 FL=1
MTDHSHDSWKPASNPWAVAIVVTLAVFMEILDTTIVNVALPHVAGSLSSSYDESTWVLTSYLVANGIVLPISAFLSRVFGRKQFFLICIFLFQPLIQLQCLICQTIKTLYFIIIFVVIIFFDTVLHKIECFICNFLNFHPVIPGKYHKTYYP